MKRNRIALLLSVLLLFALSACGGGQTAPTGSGGDVLTIAATTYPVYLFTTAVTDGVDGVEVELVVNQQTSCLHDYTLTVKDMKALERADIIVCNGAGLEESMESALETVGDTPQIDCAQGIPLLEGEDAGHHHEGGILPAGHEHEADAHIWMDPLRACSMLENLAGGLSQLDPDHAALYATNARLAREQLTQAYDLMKTSLESLSCRELITFHDGFSYFADAFDLTILRAMEEEAGSEASAREVADIVAEIRLHQLPAIFTEVNGADSTAQMIHRECGVPIFSLDLMMSDHGQDPGIAAYLALLQTNVNTLREAYA